MRWQAIQETAKRGAMKKTLFLGLGNPILSDDAVGIRVVQEIEKMLGDTQLH